MKKVFSVLAVAAMILVGLTGCGGEKTYADFLTNSKGWVLESAISVPAYVMNDGTQVDDLLNGGYLYDWEKEYILIFKENGNLLVKPGKTVAPSPEDGYMVETSLGNWSFDNNLIPTYIKMQLPWFMDEDPEICYITSLTADKMALKAVINDDDPSAKGTYEFVLTYKLAK